MSFKLGFSSSFGDAVADATASQPSRRSCDDGDGSDDCVGDASGHASGGGSASGDPVEASELTATNDVWSEGHGGVDGRVNASADNTTNSSGLFDLHPGKDDTVPPPPYKELDDKTSNTSIMDSQPASNATPPVRGLQRNCADIARQLFAHPSLPSLMISGAILYVLHMTTLQTMTTVNKVPVYIAGFMVLVLAGSLPAASSGNGNGGTNGNDHNIFLTRDFARLLVMLDATLLAGIHLSYLKDRAFDGNSFLFVGHWITVALVLCGAAYIWASDPQSRRGHSSQV